MSGLSPGSGPRSRRRGADRGTAARAAQAGGVREGSRVSAALEARELRVSFGGVEVVCGLSTTVARGRVGRAHRPQRRRQDDDACARSRASCPSRGERPARRALARGDEPARDRRAGSRSSPSTRRPRPSSPSPSTSCSGARLTSATSRARPARDRLAAERAIERLALGALRRSGRSVRSAAASCSARCSPARSPRRRAILLLDEPTSALDLGRQQQALELVDALRREEGLTRRLGHARPEPGRTVRRSAAPARPRLGSSRREPPREVLSEATIGSYYGADVRVIHDHGSVFVLPRRGAAMSPGRRTRRAAPARRRRARR